MFLTGVAEADAHIAITDEVISPERIAFVLTCTLSQERRIIEYDEGGVNIADPGRGAFGYLTWDYFLSTWPIMDCMMLAVYPV